MPSFEHWYLLPTGIVVATAAMSSGVSAANFWIPIYLIAIRLDPPIAFWSALATMLFGFGSGTLRNHLDGQVDWAYLRRAALVLCPMTAAGTLASGHLPVASLLLGFACFAVCYGLWLISSPRRRKTTTRRTSMLDRHRGRIAAWAVAGSSHGLIATGSGVLLLPTILRDASIGHHARAVGTTTGLILLCSLTGVAFRLDVELVAVLSERWSDIVGIVGFAGTGAFLGGQIGPRVARRIPKAYLAPYVGGLLLVVGTLVFVRGFGLSTGS